MLFIVLCLVVVGFVLLDMKKPANFPRGPLWLPFIGR